MALVGRNARSVTLQPLQIPSAYLTNKLCCCIECNKCKSNEDVILCENDNIINIINHLNEVVNIFNDYFTARADGIGFNDPIPGDYETDAAKRYQFDDMGLDN